MIRALCKQRRGDVGRQSAEGVEFAEVALRCLTALIIARSNRPSFSREGSARIAGDGHGKLSVYLKALELDAGEEWAAWVG